MIFITNICSPKYTNYYPNLSNLLKMYPLRKSPILTKERVKHLESVFKTNTGNDVTMDIQQFKKIIQSKNVCIAWINNGKVTTFLIQDFHAERIFNIFDEDRSGQLSFDQLLHCLQELSAYGNDEKVMLLFKIYDMDGMK